MTLDQAAITAYLDQALANASYIGLAVFAASGALTASRKQMDIGGFAVVATVTALGGGTVRDLLMGERPVYWVNEPQYAILCVVVAMAVFFSAPFLESRFRLLVWADAVGLSLFCGTGTEKALSAGVPEVSAIVLGVITSTFGGIVRDVLCAEIPLILRKEIYATAALAGATAYVIARDFDFTELRATGVAFLVCFFIRGFSVATGLSLPVYQHRPGRAYEGMALKEDAGADAAKAAETGTS